MASSQGVCAAPGNSDDFVTEKPAHIEKTAVDLAALLENYSQHHYVASPKVDLAPLLQEYSRSLKGKLTNEIVAQHDDDPRPWDDYLILIEL